MSDSTDPAQRRSAARYKRDSGDHGRSHSCKAKRFLVVLLASIFCRRFTALYLAGDSCRFDFRVQASIHFLQPCLLRL
ncbi:hypothetical protein CEXT_123661 [Caerostris extrusa]|uniref:Uncharacterized protein n=1 Tax=Caerostris extrusa TaxID=172846 RepID=A0AAV4XJS0_CAEEX|nr:hypothetical protein CEXT_123661 [Caerostris extrusa]